MVRKQYALIDLDSNLESDSPLSTKPKPKPKPKTKAKTPEQSAEAEHPMKLSYTEQEIFEEEETRPRMTRVEMRARRAIYNEIKAKVKQMEAHNTSKMIIFRDFRAPWFKAGGKSALYYAYDIAGRLGKRNVNVNPDNDGHSVFDDGVVSFHGILNLIDNLEDKTDIEKPRILNDGWILVFDLQHTYDKAELKSLRELSKERKRKVNALVMPENCHPVIYNDILALIRRTVPKVFKLQPPARDAFGKHVTNALINLHAAFLEFANDEGDAVELLYKMFDEAQAINSDMKLLLELKMWDVGVCAPIAQAIAKLLTDLKAEIAERSETSEPLELTELSKPSADV